MILIEIYQQFLILSSFHKRNQKFPINIYIIHTDKITNKSYGIFMIISKKYDL